MRIASSTDYAIMCAMIDNTLRLVERPSRFGGTFIAIEDNKGVIEIANDTAEADKRLAPFREHLA